FLSAKLMSGLLYMSLYSVLMASCYWTFAMKQDIPTDETVTILRFFVTQYEVSFLISLSLGMLLSVLIKNRFVYLIAFCAWMFGTLFMEIFIINQGELYFLKAFHLTYLFVDSILVNGAWGIHLINEEIQFQRLFVITVSAFMLSFIVFILNIRRPHQFDKVWKIILFSCMGIVVISYLPYAAFWNERIDEFTTIKENAPFFTEGEDRQEVYMKYPPLPNSDGLVEGEGERYEPDRFEINQFQLSLEHHTDDLLAIEANLTIPEEELETRDVINFTLNRTFNVKDVMIDDQPIPFTQHNDFLTITLPDTVQTPVLQFHYGGNYKLWTSNAGQEYYPGYVVDNQMIMPSQTAWYPLPGHQFLYDLTGESQTDVGLENRAEFNVTVSGITTRLFGTIEEQQLNNETFELKGQAAKLDLYAGNLTEVESMHFPFSIVTTNYNRNKAKKLIKQLDERLLYTDRYLTKEIEPIRHLFLLPVENIRWANFMRQQGFIDQNYILSESSFYQMDETYLMKLFLQINLLHDDTEIYGFEDGKLVTSAIFTAYTYLYELEHNQFDEATRVKSSVITISDDIPSEKYTDEEIQANNIFTMIKSAVDVGKEKQVKDVLNRIYSEQWVDPGFTSDFTLFREPSTFLTYEDWQKTWDEVMHENQIREEGRG
ncbi:MAG: hypothetical protein WCF60_14935, partial [Anaerobacillus sp.]